MNSAAWTTVTKGEYQQWAARFVREDAFFALFGLVLVGFAGAVRTLRRQLIRRGIADRR